MSNNEHLDARLRGILLCSLCKSLPNATIFQCPLGHLICTSCLTGIQRAGPLEAPCPQPQCGSLLSKALVARNVAVEKVVQELPTDCGFCGQFLPRRLLGSHERDVCHMRPTGCQYRVIGCAWRGPQVEAGAHERACPWPRKPGAEVMATLLLSDQLALRVKRQCDRVFHLLSSEAIVFEDIQLKPKETPCPGEDCLESFTFEAFRNTWLVQARVKQQVSHPELSYQGNHTFESTMFSAFNKKWVVRVQFFFRLPLSTIPDLTYQLMLKSKIELPCEVTFCLLQGPFGDFKVDPIINKHLFVAENDVSADVTLNIVDCSSPHNAVSNPWFFKFRIVMFSNFKTEP